MTLKALSHPRVILPQAAALVMLTMPVSAVAQPAAPDQRDGKALAVEGCARLPDDSERLACFDAATDAPLRTPDGASGTATGANGDNDRGVMKSLLERYVAAEKAVFSFSGSFVGHQPTYLLPFTWVESPNRAPFSPTLGTTGYDYTLDRKEAKYQISFKVPLLTGLLDGPTTLWFGYTQKSFWQVYNTADSAPFRETNYEPEIFLRYQANYDIGPATFGGLTLGLNHQSNGQSEPRSRSWNRIKGSAALSYNRWLFMVHPWYRLPERDAEDDNPNIERYIGYADYYAIYRLNEDRTLTMRLQNNLRSENNRTSVELSYSFPIGDTLKGYVQYYNGYGESLIDYNDRIQRFGVGLMLNDWL